MSKIDESTMSSLNEVTTIWKRGDFRTVKNVFGEGKLKRLLLRTYPKHTIKEIEGATGIPDSTLSFWFKRFGIPLERWHARQLSKPGKSDAYAIKIKKGKISKVNTVKITPELAYAIGFALGDGAVQRYMVEVFNKDAGPREHLRETLKKYGAVSEDRGDNGLWRLRLSSVKIANLVKKNKKANTETINHILSKSKLGRIFIAAFWDAEGSVAKQHKYTHIYLYNSDKRILDAIGRYLKQKGIPYTMRFNYQPNRIYYLNGHKVETKKRIYRVSIPKFCAVKWAKEIGIHMLHSKKRKMVEEILKTVEGDMHGK